MATTTTDEPSHHGEPGQRLDKREVDDFGFYLDSSTTSQVAPSSRSVRSSTTQRTGRWRGDPNKRAESQWLAMLDRWDTTTKARNKKKIKRLCRAGIPESLRGTVWTKLTGADLIRKDDVYNRMKETESNPIFEVIERDVHRCFPNHQMFSEKDGQGQKDLFAVLKAYAVYNPEVGYCQGMGMLVGMMLMHMPPEDTFWLLVATTQGAFKDYFIPTLYQLRIDAAVFELILYQKSRKLSNHLAKNDVTPLTYITQWFMTCFTGTLKWDLALRIWDVVCCDGAKAMIRFALAIMFTSKDHLLRHSPSTGDILSYLLHLPPDFPGIPNDEFIDAAIGIELKKAKLGALRLKAEAMAKVDGVEERGEVTLLKKRKGMK
ncbi:rab-GTPase-TBC domain-containing protein [Cladochytrium replicatum]|nr:rab-GTPase-TBC domain-containing protein [Cladochytrium replicatum]